MADKVQRTRERAYQIWQQEGQPEGRDSENWLQAERELQEGSDAESAPESGSAEETIADSEAAEALAAQTANAG